MDDWSDSEQRDLSDKLLGKAQRYARTAMRPQQQLIVGHSE